MNSWRVDDAQSLHNLVVDFDLLCESKWAVGLLGSCFYIGEFFASLLVSFFSFNSRIKVLKNRNIMLLMALSYLLICERNKTHVYIASFFLGAALAVMMIVGYSYVIEMTPLHHRNSVGTTILSIDKAVLLISIIYLKFVNN